MPGALKTPALCEEAVRQNGWALEFVPGELRTQELCLKAVKDAGQALQFAEHDDRTLNLCAEAVRQDADAIQFVPEDLKDAVQTAVRRDDFSIPSAPWIQENPQDADEDACGPRP